jgi:protein-L-isoaspartate(D-aspartate) O-methyltransferase
MKESFPMLATVTDFSAARRFMIDGQIRPNDVNDPQLLKAFENLPREIFVPDAFHNTAYAERAVPLGNGRYVLEPMVLARMVQAAAARETSKVLIVGCNTGYGAAIFSHLAAHIYALESEEKLVHAARANLAACNIHNVQVVQGGLGEGYASGAPYDVIMLEGSCAVLPEQFAHQLCHDGRLVAIVGEGRAAQGMLYIRTSSGLSGRPLFETAAPILPGFERRLDFVF